MQLFYRNPKATAAERKQGIIDFLTILGRKEDVTFRFDMPASTNGRVVCLGELLDAEGNIIDDRLFETRALGHGIHEMMHVAETEMSASAVRIPGQFAAALTNILEDIRIDSIGMKRYPGYKIWREALCAELRKMNMLRQCRVNEQTDSLELFATWIFTRLLYDIGFDWVEEFVDKVDDAIKDRLHPTYLVNSLTIAREVHEAKSTSEVLEIVRKLIDYTKESCATRRKRNPDGTLAAPNPRCPFKRADKSEIRKLLDKRDAKFEENMNSYMQAKADHARRMQKEAPTEAFAKGEPGANYTCAEWPAVPNNKIVENDIQEYTPIFEEMRAELELGKERFARMLRIRKPDDRESYIEGDSLAPDFVAHLASRDGRVFGKTVEHKVNDHTVVILLDRSGSMGLATMSKAKAAVASLHLALKNTRGITPVTAMFPGPDNTSVATASVAGETDAAYMKRMAGIGACGSTPIYEAICWGKAELEKAKTEGKLLLVITDGNYPTSKTASTEPALNAAGIDFAVMSIDAGNHGLAKNSANVTSNEMIAPALYKIFSKTKLAIERRNAA